MNRHTPPSHQRPSSSIAPPVTVAPAADDLRTTEMTATPILCPMHLISIQDFLEPKELACHKQLLRANKLVTWKPAVRGACAYMHARARTPRAHATHTHTRARAHVYTHTRIFTCTRMRTLLCALDYMCILCAH
jgi:hypothetical protein